MNENDLKTVAIVGRPNVGKSSIFNRLIGHRLAIETPIAGTTRDRLYGLVFWGGFNFDLIDVAGIEYGSKKEIDQSVQEGVNLAIDNADLILFAVDWQEKDNQTDLLIARNLRKIKEKVIVVVNKADNIERQRNIEEFKRLGDFPVMPVSAISGMNSGDLLDLIVKKLKIEKTVKAKEDTDFYLSIIGRPNAGKSTLLNSIIGKKRAVVSAEAGTTRDIIDVKFEHKGCKIRIVDTAGIRRPGKVDRDTIESFSVIRAYKALKSSDVAIVVIDATEGLVALDTHILGKAKEWGKGIILAVNKLDLIENPNEFMTRTIWQLQEKLNFAPWLPIVFISAQESQNVKSLLSQTVKIWESKNTTISQGDLDEILNKSKEMNAQLLVFTSIKQERTNPPVFKLYYKGRKKPHYSLARYLENKIRDVYPMNGTPIFIDTVFRKKS